MTGKMYCRKYSKISSYFSTQMPTVGPCQNNTEAQLIKYPEPKEGLALRYTISVQLGTNERKEFGKLCKSGSSGGPDFPVVKAGTAPLNTVINFQQFRITIFVFLKPVNLTTRFQLSNLVTEKLTSFNNNNISSFFSLQFRLKKMV